MNPAHPENPVILSHLKFFFADSLRFSGFA
jgi:hypothetical protein